MDEMSAVRNLRADAPASDHLRLTPGRQRLLDEIEGRRRRRGGWRLAAVSVAAAVVAAVVLASQLGPDTGRGKPEVGQSITVEPRDSQWIYRKVMVTQADLSFVNDLNPTSDGDGEPAAHETETWTQYGTGKERQTLPTGALDAYVTQANWGSPKALRNMVGGLPDESPALLRDLRGLVPIDDRDVGADKGDYLRIVCAYSEVDVIPPRVRSALFEALKTIPRVKISERLVDDALGRPSLAVHFTSTDRTKDLNLQDELLLDPDSYEYRGGRTMYLAGGKLNGKATTKDTLVDVSAVVRQGVVDKPGHRP
ncbi:hypothetical protein [Streptomyces sp. NPDC059828]|uniref:hypothetical protein n=1 Tax=Streptomyces sp. NPDC059828 TaxID=3346965 RepID=UPI003664B5B9